MEEKRKCKRFPFKANVRFAYFNQKNFYDARLLEFSEGGISFYSKTPIKAGTTILIKLEQISPAVCKDIELKGLKTISLVETRWCREVRGQHNLEEYEIGAQFFMCD